MNGFFSRPWARQGVGAGAAAALVAAIFWVVLATRATPTLMATAATAAVPAVPGALARVPAPTGRHLLFESNQGQAPKAVRYLARGAGREMAIFDDGMALASIGHEGQGTAAAQLRFIGSRSDAPFAEREPAAARVSYLRGTDSAAWQRQVPRFGQLVQRGLYPGIDLVYYSRDGDFEFDLVVQPGADPAQVRLRASGPRPAFVDAAGDLWLDGEGGQLRVKRPVGQQHIGGQRIELAGRWVLGAEGVLTLAMAPHDPRHVLVIDPVFKLLYATYVGGVHDEQASAMTLDAQGNAYVVGFSGSEDWPVSGNAVQTTRRALGRYVRNVVVTKFDASGTLVWSTFLGGSVNDYGRGIAVDAKGQVVIAGLTLSSDFPTTAQAQQRTLNGSQNAFLAVLSPDGSSLVHSTYFGGAGNSEANALALDADGSVVIAGAADPGLPTTPGAYKPTLAAGRGAFVARFSAPALGAPQLLAASYLGVDNPAPNGTRQGVEALGMALDASGAPWLAAIAYTPNLPVTPGAVQGAPAAMSASCTNGPGPLNSFAYFGKLSRDFSTLQYGSYLSGRTQPAGGTSCSEFGRNVALDADGSVYLTGSTGSAAFPTTPGAVQAGTPIGASFGAYASFVAKLRPDGGALLWSTYLGGNQAQNFTSTLAYDAARHAVWAVSMTGGGSNYPLTPDALQPAHGGGGAADVGLVQFDAATGALKYSSYLGGAGNDNGLALAVDGSGTVVVAGATESRNFPVTANAFQGAYTANAYDGSDWFFAILGSGAIARVQPAAAGHGGDVTLRLNGSGLVSGSACALQGAGGQIDASAVAASVAAEAAGSQMACTFTLANATPGVYDVVVTLADGTVLRRAAAFTVLDQAVGASLSASLVGRSAVRVGTPSRQQLTVSNTGDANAYAPMALLHVPRSMRVALKLRKLGPAFAGDPTPYDGSFGPEQSDATSATYAVVFPVIPAGGSATLEFDVTADTGGDDVEITATVCPSGATTIEDWKAYAAHRATQQTVQRGGPAGARALAAGRSRPLLTAAQSIRCFGSLLLAGAGVAAGAAGLGLAGPELVMGAAVAALGGVVVQGFANAAEGGAVSMSDVTMNGLQSTIGATLHGAAANLFNAIDILNNCDPDGSLRRDLARRIKRVQALDPNDKSGPLGDGSAQHFLRAPQPLAYQIAFENRAVATAAAAQVVITDRLDPAHFDLATVTLGAITWGPYRIEVPAGLASYATVFPIDATMSVRVQGSLDPTTGVLKWTLTTLDPATHLPPSDPTLGILPPNVNGTQGQGYVNFTVTPKAGAVEGGRWENFASIVFDANAPIVTPTWVNTLDGTAPVGRVGAATQRTGSTDVDVSWSATDAGSGAARYTVRVSDNGGAFAAWQSNVSATSAVFHGSAGHAYGFHVIATDAAGNTEAAKTVAEASVSVRDPGAPAASDGGGGGCTVAPPGREDHALLLLVGALLTWRAAAFARRRINARQSPRRRWRRAGWRCTGTR